MAAMDNIKKNKPVIIIYIYALVLVAIHFFRIFDNNFWGDETFSINLCKLSIPEMIGITAADVHPPLYYLILKLFCTLFGFRGPVFHFASLSAYLCVIAVSLTLIRSRFGNMTSFLFISFISLLPNCFTYNVEVRNYSYGALFVLLAFLSLEGILTKNRTKDHVLFTVFSLAAAYTHYYCLVTVAFLYMVLIIFSIIRRKDHLKNTVICCVMTVILYLPWSIVLLTTFMRSSGDDFWMLWIPTLEDCISYIFAGKLSFVLCGILIILALIILIPMLKNLKDNLPVMFWVCAGFASVFGTILTGIIVSRLIRPLFITRYLYPASILAWLLLSYFVSRLKGRWQAVTGFVVFIVLILSSFTESFNLVKKEYAEIDVVESTLAASSGVGPQDMILTDCMALDWSLSDYYYPGTEHILIEDGDLPKPDEDKTCWLMINPDSLPLYEDSLTAQGYTAECKIKNGMLGTQPLEIYLLSKNG